MSQKPRDLTALLGSRICHDLISPLGAIGNGVELLEMSNAANSAEVALIRDSVTNANAKVRFFRVAFGDSAHAQQMRGREIGAILKEYSEQARVDITWTSTEDPMRREAKLAFLLIQCLETTMPFGGTITCGCESGNWTLHAQAERLKIDTNLWQLVSEDNPDIEVSAAQIQFVLVASALKDCGKTLSAEFHDTEITITF
ncbi:MULTISPECIES: histidine phosphotransferase family protein [Halocynthiibacter]|uniref:Histidine phosphotransferase family protein n=1 Tax=Halocynthiibacter halioticoli TaxID=2986804 RepID=A0AAE3J051_9RHOB|nr:MULTISPECIES: histidine phosphotransferase family protein [Halocynthiibacter]MCV6824285.1 histidine phosphotransferase family protein [Halocynthiibacter halioticoli]MCW4057286.1 histidine phosphotransferase family protein [Halocynthiibacter sp. SDUM655004]